jgi:peptide/nickel transport system substrate-binding protein
MKLLKEAGYKGQKLTLTTNPNAATMKDTAIMIQAMLAQVGLNIDIEVVELGTMVERYFGGRYQLMTYNYAATLDPGQFLDRVIGEKARDKAKVWDSPRSRELLAALVATDDRTEKQRVMDDLHRLYLEELPLIAWTTRVSFAAYTDRVKGYEIWPGGKPRFWNIALAP